VSNEVLSFGDFRLDPLERRLTRAGEPVDLSGRYLDALRLLAANPGSLITKDRLLDEVWKGVPVTDEALTQCIRSLRRVLGDDAARPRFIETVPRHGYRFIAPTGSSAAATRQAPSERRPAAQRPSPLLLAAAGLAGGAAAGLIGGIGYGLLAATEPPPGTGAISILLVLTCLCLLVGLLGGAGVGAGIAAARQFAGRRLSPLMLGGALGGLAVGALGRLVGLDAFALVVGSRPVQITGGSEGLLIGALAGAAAWLALERRWLSERLALAGAGLGALAGLLVILGGGQMMAGSLAVLASAHPGSPLGTLLGETALSGWVRLLAATVEGATFVGALGLAFGWVARQAGGTEPPA
jgi:DNA-binding winged helix-turn-helix (wHTH) protein